MKKASFICLVENVIKLLVRSKTNWEKKTVVTERNSTANTEVQANTTVEDSDQNISSENVPTPTQKGENVAVIDTAGNDIIDLTKSTAVLQYDLS